MQALLDAANTFPRGTGLGWDQLHPRTLNRLSHGILIWICAVLHSAETTGRWPEAAELVLIALLPKAEGGFRAIGLLPFLPLVRSAFPMQCADDDMTLIEGCESGKPVIQDRPGNGRDSLQECAAKESSATDALGGRS